MFGVCTYIAGVANLFVRWLRRTRVYLEGGGGGGCLTRHLQFVAHAIRIAFSILRLWYVPEKLKDHRHTVYCSRRPKNCVDFAHAEATCRAEFSWPMLFTEHVSVINFLILFFCFWGIIRANTRSLRRCWAKQSRGTCINSILVSAVAEFVNYSYMKQLRFPRVDSLRIFLKNKKNKSKLRIKWQRRQSGCTHHENPHHQLNARNFDSQDVERRWRSARAYNNWLQ